MKWWSKCISMIITKTASRNVAFKAARMSESMLESQEEVIIRQPEGEEARNDEDINMQVYTGRCCTT